MQCKKRMTMQNENFLHFGNLLNGQLAYRLLNPIATDHHPFDQVGAK